MEQKLSNELYEPPEVALCLVQVELGYDASSSGSGGGSYNPPSSGGGGSTSTGLNDGASADDWIYEGGSWE